MSSAIAKHSAPRAFRLGYNTNGLAHHRLEDAFRLLAKLGYEAVAVTPDVGQLDLYRLDRAEVRRVRKLARELELEVAVETGARFLMDPERKHWPTLLAPGASDRGRRVDFLRRSIDLAVELGAGVVSIWSGAAPDGRTGDPRGSTPGLPGARPSKRSLPSAPVERSWERLVSSLFAVLDHAAAAGVQVGFEPEPGMFVERPTGYLELVRRLGPRGGELGLTLDVGHLLATRDLPVDDQIRALAARLVHVQLDDAPLGRHEHRMFGTGALELAPTLRALREIGFAGMAAVELSRDSHRGADAAREAMEHLVAAKRTPRRPRRT